jgi:hypothetical protein
MIFSIKEVKLSFLPSFEFEGMVCKSNIFLPYKKTISYNMKELENKIRKEGYNPEKYNYITVFNFFNRVIVLNGKHRISVLKKIYGPDHEIKIKYC